MSGGRSGVQGMERQRGARAVGVGLAGSLAGAGLGLLAGAASGRSLAGLGLLVVLGGLAYPADAFAQAARADLAAPAEHVLRADASWAPTSALASARAYRMASRVLGEERRVFVHLPPSHGLTDRPYPLVLVMDGEAIFEVVVQAAAALARAGHMPEAVVVGVENTDRLRDLSPPGIPVSGNDGRGQADRFLRYLTTELAPALATELRAGAPGVVVGHSSGALFVHYALAVAPEAFPYGAALDAPMHLGDGAASGLLLDSQEARGQPLRLVSMESRFGWLADDWSRLVESRPEDWRLTRVAVDGESHGSMVWPASYDALKALFADYSTVASAAHTPLDRLERFDAARDGRPTSLPPPPTLLAQAVEDHIGALDLEAAEATLDRLTRGYGDDEITARLRSRIEAARGEELEGPTLEEMRATPWPSAELVAPLVGRWEGFTQIEGGSMRTPLALTLRIEDGRPTGTIAVGSTPPRAIEYMTGEGDAFQVGYMNGMRPRGMLVYDGTLAGDVFEGEFVLRGVVFRLPDGRELPTTRFRLERVPG